MAVPKKVRRLQEGIDDQYMHFLLCAGPGFGKTVLFGSDDKVLFLTTDQEGTISAAMLGSNAMEWEIKAWTDLTEAYVYLRDGGIKELGLDDGGWVVIDNISEAEELGKWGNIDLERKRNSNIDQYVPTQANYQRTQNMLLQLVKQFNDLPVHVGYTAWIDTHEDGNGMEYFAPAIHGQKGAIAQMIAGYMNIVGYGEVIEDDEGNEHRRIWFSHHGPYRGKDRFVTLGKSRTDLTLPKINALISAAIKKRKATKPGATTKAPTTAAARRPVRRTTTKKGA